MIFFNSVLALVLPRVMCGGCKLQVDIRFLVHLFPFGLSFIFCLSPHFYSRVVLLPFLLVRPRAFSIILTEFSFVIYRYLLLFVLLNPVSLSFASFFYSPISFDLCFSVILSDLSVICFDLFIPKYPCMLFHP